ncbi:hypothetical protein Ancab_026979 [Ancistrocladus abbreviatus]
MRKTRRKCLGLGATVINNRPIPGLFFVANARHGVYFWCQQFVIEIGHFSRCPKLLDDTKRCSFGTCVSVAWALEDQAVVMILAQKIQREVLIRISNKAADENLDRPELNGMPGIELPPSQNRKLW